MLPNQSYLSKFFYSLVLIIHFLNGSEDPSEWFKKCNAQALENLPSSNENNSTLRQPIFTARPYTDIAGELTKTQMDQLYNSCEERLKRRIDALVKNAQREKNYINRFILEGPTGSGKSSLAKTIVHKCQCSYLFVVGSELADEYKDSARTYVNALLKALVDLSTQNQRKALVIDEIDSFTDKYSNRNDADSGAVQYLWSQLDKFDKKNIIVIGTTNNFQRIPTQIKGRFRTSYHMDLPPLAFITNILKTTLADFNLNENTIKKIANKMNNFSLREIENFIGNIQEIIDTEAEGYIVADKDIHEALKSAIQDHKNNIASEKEEILDKKWHRFNTRYLPLIGLFVNAGISITGLLIQHHSAELPHRDLMQEQDRHHKENLRGPDRQFNNSQSQIQDFHNSDSDQSLAWKLAPLAETATAIGCDYFLFPGAGSLLKTGFASGVIHNPFVKRVYSAREIKFNDQI